MRWLLVVMMVGGLGIGGASGARSSPALEPPRATDLLRAQRMAEDVEDRRRMPAAQRGSRWRRGGEGGWGSREGSASPRGGEAIEETPPSRRGRGGK
ncbi:MAG: hypothetical protein KIT14_11975 [bacterium]|nr:hypothetical protein [bacterium]